MSGRNCNYFSKFVMLFVYFILRHKLFCGSKHVNTSGSKHVEICDVKKSSMFQNTSENKI